jgi:hypothetical protein
MSVAGAKIVTVLLSFTGCVINKECDASMLSRKATLTLNGMLNVYAYKRGSLPLRRFGQLHRLHCLIGLNNVEHLKRRVGSTSI